jgi:error-prone DNA polymerase
MDFGTMIDVDGYFLDTVHFPPSQKAYAFQGKGCYIVLRKVVDDFGFASLKASKIEKLPFVKDGRLASY